MIVPPFFFFFFFFLTCPTEWSYSSNFIIPFASREHIKKSLGSSLDTLILSAVISIWRDLWDVKQQWVIKIKSFII